MTIPLFLDSAAARATILRRVAFDEMIIPTHVSDSIAERFGERITPDEAVKRILHDVRERGDVALHEWSAKLDTNPPALFAVAEDEIAAAKHTLDSSILHALTTVAEQLTRFHQRQARNSWVDFTAEGALGQLVVPLQRVGIYVPGGAAPLPSSLLHAAIPARVAGVSDIVVCTPPQTGIGMQTILAAAAIAGIKRVFCIGGAQAIAAMAYGTDSVPQVDKIVGPGNLFVVLAKRAVYGTVDIESLPGPTETLVVADEYANPRYVAADLIAQAEHVLASAILVTPSKTLATIVQQEVTRQCDALPEPNRSAAREALAIRSGIVLVPTMNDALDVANEYAPEHLCLLVEDPWAYVGNIRNAGGVFLGEQSFEVLGDYTAGPSHIMPTGGTARYASPVNVDDFRKVISLIGVNEQALQRIGPPAMKLAEVEGLVAHAAAVRVRLEQENENNHTHTS